MSTAPTISDNWAQEFADALNVHGNQLRQLVSGLREVAVDVSNIRGTSALFKVASGELSVDGTKADASRANNSSAGVGDDADAAAQDDSKIAIECDANTLREMTESPTQMAVAFMQGRAKVNGTPGAVISFIKALSL